MQISLFSCNGTPLSGASTVDSPLYVTYGILKPLALLLALVLNCIQSLRERAVKAIGVSVGSQVSQVVSENGDADTRSKIHVYTHIRQTPPNYIQNDLGAYLQVLGIFRSISFKYMYFTFTTKFLPSLIHIDSKPSDEHPHVLRMTRMSPHLSSVARKISGMTTKIRRPLSGEIVQLHWVLAGYGPGQLGLWMQPWCSPTSPPHTRSAHSTAQIYVHWLYPCISLQYVDRNYTKITGIPQWSKLVR